MYTISLHDNEGTVIRQKSSFKLGKETIILLSVLPITKVQNTGEGSRKFTLVEFETGYTVKLTYEGPILNDKSN